jgi:hypothetical protein
MSGGSPGCEGLDGVGGGTDGLAVGDVDVGAIGAWVAALDAIAADWPADGPEHAAISMATARTERPASRTAGRFGDPMETSIVAGMRG